MPLRKVNVVIPPPKSERPQGKQTLIRKPEIKKQNDDEEDKGVPRTVTVRLHPKHYDMLDEIVKARETDKSDSLKYMIRLIHQAYQSQNAELTLTDSDGTIRAVPIVNNGNPA